MRWTPICVMALIACGTGDEDGTTDLSAERDVDGDGVAIAQGDCNDDDPTIFPGAPDVVGDGIDQNCDGIDGVDGDNDGFASEGSGGDDCDDEDGSINPEANEIGWDSVDQNCDGVDQFDYLAVCAGLDHSCAIDTVGRIVCWGSDADLQVSTAPTGEGWTEIECGERFTCAIDAVGAITCWGDDHFEEGLDADESPIDPPSGTGFASLTVGVDHACAVEGDIQIGGIAHCWGSNEFDKSEAPDTARYTSLAAGNDQTCGHSTENQFDCWGATDDLVPPPSPVDVPQNFPYGQMAAGGEHVCALRLNQGIDCWGTEDVAVRNPESDAGPYSWLSAREDASCGIIEGRTLTCWGSQFAPVLDAVPTDTDFAIVDLGNQHACGIHTSANGGNLECWGNDAFGRATPPTAEERTTGPGGGGGGGGGLP